MVIRAEFSTDFLGLPSSLSGVIWSCPTPYPAE